MFAVSLNLAGQRRRFLLKSQGLSLHGCESSGLYPGIAPGGSISLDPQLQHLP